VTAFRSGTETVPRRRIAAVPNSTSSCEVEPVS
jgi:hypothetical protein